MNHIVKKEKLFFTNAFYPLMVKNNFLLSLFIMSFYNSRRLWSLLGLLGNSCCRCQSSLISHRAKLCWVDLSYWERMHHLELPAVEHTKVVAEYSWSVQILIAAYKGNAHTARAYWHLVFWFSLPIGFILSTWVQL